MRLLRKSKMLHIDCNLYREAWKTSLLMLLSWRDISPNCLWVVMVLYHYVDTHFISIFFSRIVISISIRELIEIIISNYLSVDNWSYNFIQVTNISWYILNRQSTILIHLSSYILYSTIVSISLHSQNFLTCWQL